MKGTQIMAEQLLLTEELVDLDEVIMKIRSNESLIKAAEEENKQFKEQIKGLFLERNIPLCFVSLSSGSDYHKEY